MSAGGPRKGRERFRYYSGCASPKQYLAQCAKRIASGPARIAQIQASLAEAQRRAAQEIAAVEADVRDAELGCERMHFMLDGNGRYVAARLPAMLDKFPLGPETSANSQSKRARGRPRKDGRPPQPRSEAVRAEARQRRALRLASTADIAENPDRARRRATSLLDGRPSDKQTPTSTHLQTAEAFSSHTAELDRVPVSSDTAPGTSTSNQAGDSFERAEPPFPAPLPLPLPLVLPSLGRQVAHLLDGIAGDDLPIEVLTVADKIVEVFTPETDAEQAKSRDVRRWPSAYDPTWADAWDPDPNSRLPMIRDEPLIIAVRSGPDRIKLWPLAIQRRDLIKALMERVALGELTFEPESMSQEDLARSVRWLVFRRADHDWLFDLSRWEIERYTQRLLDVIPWPPGLSRMELLGTFGCGQGRDDVPNMSSFGRPPLWLLPEEHWIYAENFGLRHAPGMDAAYKDRPRLERVLDGTFQPCKTTHRRKRDLISRSSLPALPFSDLAAPYHSAQLGNRLLELKPDARTGYLSFAYPADVVRAELARGEAVRLGVSHLQARAEWCETNPVPLDTETTIEVAQGNCTVGLSGISA
jgi:hypothetical protein